MQLKAWMAQVDGGNYLSGNTSGTVYVGLLWHINVGDVIVLAEQEKWGEVENNPKRLGFRSEDNEFINTAIEGFGSLICTILHLLVEIGLVAQAGQLLGELIVILTPRVGLAAFLLSRVGLDFLV